MVTKLSLATAVAVSLALPVVASSAAAAESYTGTIVRVYDGDSLLVNIEGQDKDVRLIGVDAPETRTTPPECFAEESKEFLGSLLEEGATVRLKTDREQENDHRLFAYVYVDGDMVNLDMVREGYAEERAYGLPYHLRKKFLKAEQLAQKEELGLWAECY
jgi:micrococcal nuclease